MLLPSKRRNKFLALVETCEHVPVTLSEEVLHTFLQDQSGKKLGMHGSLVLHWPYWPIRAAGVACCEASLRVLSFACSGSVRSIVPFACPPTARPAYRDAGHFQVGYLRQPGPGQNVLGAVVAELLLLRGRGHRSGGEPLFWWRGSEHLPALQV